MPFRLSFAPLERWFAVREQKLDKRALAQDLGFYFLSSLTPALVMGFPLAMIAELGRALLPAGLLQASASLPLLPRLSLAFESSGSRIARPCRIDS